MKKALVAGGAGFIGSHLCDYLLSLGYEVVILDNLVTGRKENILHLLGNPRVRFLESNIIDLPVHDEKSLPLDLQQTFDEIYNLASPASPVDFHKLPIFILETAAIGHRNLLELAKRSICPILIASTSEVYGDPLVHPQVETYFGNVNTIGVRGCYDEAKRFTEALSKAYEREHKVQIRIARIFNTYGPRMNPEDGRIIPNFFSQGIRKQAATVYGDGSQTRSFCYVSDMVEGLYKLMQSKETSPVNIGNPIEKTVLEMAKISNELTGNTGNIEFLPLPENDPKQRRPDISKAKRVLQWEPKISLAEGLEKTFAYFKSQLA